jgi:hypothetical protein
VEAIPERYKSRKTADALMSPSAIVIAGAGTAAAILGGLPLLAAAGVGAVAWAARVAVGLPRAKKVDRIDPFRLSEPWRLFVKDALAAQKHFDQTVARMRSGPMQERLKQVAERVSEGVRECWQIACHGNELQHAYSQLDVQAAQQELRGLQEEKRNRRGDPASIDRAIAAVDAQLLSAQRIGDVAADARDRLRVLNAQLDEAVARAVELSVHADDVSDVASLGDDVDSLVGDLEALRQGLEESDDAAPGATSP